MCLRLLELGSVESAMLGISKRRCMCALRASLVVFMTCVKQLVLNGVLCNLKVERGP